MSIPFYQVNAFTTQLFKGNPAAVCLLTTPFANEATYLQVAGEAATPETSFVCPLETSDWLATSSFSLRWFMPTHEVRMCGHATLAASYILFFELQHPSPTLTFKTLSGEIIANRLTDDSIALDFPSDNFEDFVPSPKLCQLLDIQYFEGAIFSPSRATAVIAVKDFDTLRALKPQFTALLTHQERGIKKIAVTTRGTSPYDFVSRCFCPWIGINEDALSAATHTLIAGYWANSLQKKEFYAWQASRRTGELHIVLKDNQRADLIGRAVVSLKGVLNIG